MVAPSLKPFRRTFGHLAEHRVGLLFGLICSAAWAILALVFTDLAGDVLDLVNSLAERPREDARGLLLRAALLLLSVRCAEIGCRFLGGLIVQTISRRVEASMKDELISHVGSLPASWFDRVRTGDLISRLTQDVGMLRRLAGPTMLQLMTTLIIVPGGMYMIIRMSPNLFLAMIAAFVVVMLGVSRLMPRLRRQTRLVQEATAKLSQRSSEDFSGIRVLSTFGRSGHQSELMGDLCDEYLERSIALTRMQAQLMVIVQSCRYLSVFGVLVVGVLDGMAGRVSMGELFKLVLLASVIVRPLLGVSTGLATLHSAAAAAERVEELFAAQPESRQGLVPKLRGKIEVRNLTFRYQGETRPVLSDVSFSLEAGGKLGLVGPAGSGKSTVLALLTRLYDPPPGTVFVDGFDVLELAPEALRAAFAMAPQDAFLFSDTIEANIAFGADADLHGLEKAVQVSAVDQDMESYPDGLSTAIGERGITLSGGQRQRISLARALASGRGTLLLDDALSGVDYQTEAVIRERLDRARGDRTLLIASHRISALADADLILVFKEGRVVEHGTHDELIAVAGYYADAHAQQRQRDALEGREGS
jgi:ATP-binding cassette subfamily B protein